MIASLRKRHLFIWSFLAFLLPIALAAAYMGIPARISDQAFDPELPAALPLQLASHQESNLKLFLRADKQTGRQQLEIIVLEPLVSASTLVYVSENALENDLPSKNLIGILGSRGKYRLDIPREIQLRKSVHITLYDAIRSKTIQTIHLTL
jgi:hypothetical protein